MVVMFRLIIIIFYLFLFALTNSQSSVIFQDNFNGWLPENSFNTGGGNYDFPEGSGWEIPNKWNTWHIVGESSLTVTVEISGDNVTFTRSSGDWTTNFGVGANITLAGFSNNENNTSFNVTNLTSTVLTASKGGAVAEGPTSSISYQVKSGTFDGVTHYSGEVSSPGRGLTGQSLKIWRHSTFTTGYNGALYYLFPDSPTYREIYMRFYSKIPIEMDKTDFTTYLKGWRYNLRGGSGTEIYFGYTPDGSGSFRNTARLVAYSSLMGNVVIATNEQLPWDGQWHCYEVHIIFGAGANGTLELWLDGNKLYSSNVFDYGTNSDDNFHFMQHFGIGNADATSTPWQNSWSAFEFDDLIISTTYNGPDASHTGISLTGASFQ